MAAQSLVVAYELLAVACGIDFPDQGLNPRPLQWGHSPSRWTTRKSPFAGFLFWLPDCYIIDPHSILKQNPNIQFNLAPYLGVVPLGLSGGEEDKSSNLGKLGGWGTWSGHLLPVPETLGTSLNTEGNDTASSASCCGCVAIFIIVPFFPYGALLLLIFQGDTYTRDLKSYVLVSWMSYLALSRRWHSTLKWETTWTV